MTVEMGGAELFRQFIPFQSFQLHTWTQRCDTLTEVIYLQNQNKGVFEMFNVGPSLSKQVRQLRLLQVPRLLPPGLEEVEERAARRELHDDDHGLVLEEVLVVLDDVGVVQHGQDLDLGQDAVPVS